MERIQAQLILEILGRPQEHVKEALNTIVVRMGSEKTINVLEKNYHEPKQIEGKNLYTAFADLTIELDSLADYFAILLTYMPSHIEIIHPEKLSLSNSNLNDLGNSLIKRLHDYDAITKKMIIERDVLARKLKEIAPELFQKETRQEKNTKQSKSKDKKAKK